MVQAAGQYERVNAPLPEISEPIALLDGKDVMEWALNDTGQWENSQANIPRRWSDGQFNSISKVWIRISNQDYLGLIFSFTTGDYSYPESGKGWYNFEYHYLYVFKAHEIDRFLYPKGMPEKPRQVRINILYKASAPELNLLPRSLQRRILNPDNKFENDKVSSLNLRFNLLPLSDQGLVRFTVVEACARIPGFWRFRRVTHANIQVNLFLDGKLLSPATFREHYYEVEFERFNQVFGLKKEN